MPGASLSRWTLAYFAAALVFLVAAQGLMVAGFGYPTTALEAPETLIVVHLVAIGWLSLLMCGALLQFVPVLVARPLLGDKLPLLALVLIVGGLLALVAGFAGLGGEIDIPAQILPLGGSLLVAGFGCVLVVLGRTLWSGRPLPLPARFVVVGLCALAGTALLGDTFAMTLSGLLGGEAALSLLLHGVPVHAILGLGGWMSFTAMGVSYRLLSMFMLAPETERRSTFIVLAAGTLALMLAAAAIAFAMAASGGTGALLFGAAAAGLCAIAIYGFAMLALYRQRRRRKIELNARAAIGALVCLGGAGILVAALILWPSQELMAGLAYLVAFGWLGGLGLAKLYKIIAFMTWLECFAPVLGKQPTPRVQDLVNEASAAPWFWAYYAAVAFGTAMLTLGLGMAFRVCVAVQLAATLGLIRQFCRSRLLANVPAALRDAFAIPHPFLTTTTVRKPR